MAFKKVKTISTGVRLYYDSSTGDYEVRSQKSSLKRYIEGRGEQVIYQNGIFQPGQTGKLTQEQTDDILNTIYDIKKKIGVKAIASLPADYKQTEADAFESAKKWELSKTDDITEKGEVFNNSDIQNGSSNTLLKSFIMMKYPIDADYGNTQDYMLIKQYSYKPVRGDLFTGEGDVLNTFANGVERDNPKKDLINQVKLPIPNTLTDSNNVSWGQDSMNAMGAALAGAVSKVVNPKNIDSLVNNFGATLQKGADTAGNAVKDIFTEDGIKRAKNNLTQILNNPNMQNVATANIGSKVLSMLGQNMSAESILARGQGVIPNSNLELLFNSPALRKFSFTWRMSPRSREEAMMVNKIVRSFKQGMSAKKLNPTSGGASFFLGTPNVFDLQFRTGGGQFIDGLFRVKTSACTSTSISYTDGAQWSAYDDGQPTSINLTLSFEELEPIYDTDYSETPLAAKDSLEPVPDTSIGY